MRRFRAKSMRIVSATIAAAMTMLLSVNCVAAEMTPAEMACCAAMPHNCGGMAQEHECCLTEAPRVDQASSVPRVAIAPPVLTVIATIPVDLVVPSVLNPHGSASHVTSAKPPGLPTYLALSSLRI